MVRKSRTSNRKVACIALHTISPDKKFLDVSACDLAAIRSFPERNIRVPQEQWTERSLL
jgi:hypothetical protein